MSDVTVPQAYQNSCEIATDAKGNPKVTVKAYSEVLGNAVRAAIIHYRQAVAELEEKPDA